VNLIVYVSDALRPDYLGCYGARYMRTPTIDELAAEGVRFDQAVSVAAWTCPSTVSMITGLFPHRHGYMHWDVEPDPSLPTLFTVAAANGYATASFVFDDDYLFKGFADANVAGSSYDLDDAVEWLRAHRDEPFVLWFHSWATHMPYDIYHAERKEWLAAKEEIIAGIQSDTASGLEALRESYRQAVERQSESLLAPFLEELDSLGLRERTALAFVSDHGETWGERFEDKQDVKGIYHMHGSALYDESVQIPLILSAPGRLQPGVVPSQVSTVDLLPTLLGLAGIGLDGIDGASLLPLADGSEQGDRPVFLAGTDMGALSQLALRQPPWKLILHVESGAEEAYNLDLDPRERHSRPDDVPAELRERLYAELEGVERRQLSPDEEAAVTARLSDLGYL
jgi:arylsulfatase A-like enzyme